MEIKGEMDKFQVCRTIGDDGFVLWERQIRSDGLASPIGTWVQCNGLHEDMELAYQMGGDGVRRDLEKYYEETFGKENLTVE